MIFAQGPQTFGLRFSFPESELKAGVSDRAVGGGTGSHCGKHEGASSPDEHAVSTWPPGYRSLSGLTYLVHTLTGASAIQGAACVPVQQPRLPASFQRAHVVSTCRDGAPRLHRHSCRSEK